LDDAERSTYPMTGNVQAGPGTYICEASVRFLVQKAIGPWGVWAAVLDQINIQPSVVVIIEKSPARAHLIGHKVIRARVMNEVQPRAFGDLLKPLPACRRVARHLLPVMGL